MELLRNTRIDFIGRRKAAFVLSAGLVFLGTVALVQIWRGAANLGIDFVGGTSVQVRFQDPVDLGAIRGVLSPAGPTRARRHPRPGCHPRCNSLARHRSRHMSTRHNSLESL